MTSQESLRTHAFIAAYHIEQALICIEVAREISRDSRVAVDHIVDERKLQHLADRLRQLAEEPAS